MKKLSKLVISVPEPTPQISEYCQMSPYCNGPVQILPGLYLGSWKTATDINTLEELGIVCVLNVAKEIDDTTCNQSSQVNIQEPKKIDHFKFNWTHDQDLVPSIDSAIEVISKCQAQGKPLLVHCLQGLSRSAALTIGYVMKTQKVHCQQAYEFVKSKAPSISPNVGLISHLVELEKRWNWYLDIRV